VIRADDSGCGMSEETRRRVFEPFFTTKGAQGNGPGTAGRSKSEDNREILRSLADLLRESGCLVIEAPDGMTALARIQAEPIDLVLTDLAMPGISGWEVATACRERFPHAPIGLITGFGDQLEPQKIERHGIQFVVAKPFTSTDALAFGAPVSTAGPAALIVPTTFGAVAAGAHVAPPSAPILGRIHEEPPTVVPGALSNEG
jgi:CheY-like chemotaxis protein